MAGKAESIKPHLKVGQLIQLSQSHTTPDGALLPSGAQGVISSIIKHKTSSTDDKDAAMAKTSATDDRDAAISKNDGRSYTIFFKKVDQPHGVCIKDDIECGLAREQFVGPIMRIYYIRHGHSWMNHKYSAKKYLGEKLLHSMSRSGLLKDALLTKSGMDDG